MLYAKIIAKGSIADVAAEAAMHGLAIQGATHANAEATQNGLATFVGECYPNRDGLDAERFRSRVREWFHSHNDMPFPMGALLWFNFGGDATEKES